MLCRERKARWESFGRALRAAARSRSIVSLDLMTLVVRRGGSLRMSVPGGMVRRAISDLPLPGMGAILKSGCDGVEVAVVVNVEFPFWDGGSDVVDGIVDFRTDGV